MIAPIALLFLLLSAGQPAAEESASRQVPTEEVSIGLFSLFKPEVIDVRPAASCTISLPPETVGQHRIDSDTRVRVRMNGLLVSAEIMDAHGITRTVSGSEIAFHGAPSPLLMLALPGRLTRSVRGNLRISVTEVADRRRLLIVVSTPRESAVGSIVAAEMDPASPPEALKAMAVAARTYMMANPQRHRTEGFDFCDTTHCQVYRAEGDLEKYQTSIAIERAVTETVGHHLSYQGRVIEGFYTAACGGLSTTPETVWGGAVTSGFPYQRRACTWCRNSPYWRWKRSANAGRVIQALSSAVGYSLSDALEIQLRADERTDLVKEVVLRDRGRRERMSTEEFRRAIGMELGWNRVLSPSFTIQRVGGVFVISGRGFGSQAGLCVAGAIAQARAGRNYLSILDSYFPKAIMTRSSKP